MIENQSDNIDIKENDVSNQDNVPEDTSSAEAKICLLYTSPSPRDA